MTEEEKYKWGEAVACAVLFPWTLAKLLWFSLRVLWFRIRWEPVLKRYDPLKGHPVPWKAIAKLQRLHQ